VIDVNQKPVDPNQPKAVIQIALMPSGQVAINHPENLALALQMLGAATNRLAQKLAAEDKPERKIVVPGVQVRLNGPLR
jgi:phosphoribosylcarboxyaminoimidazole (NCAIR) mutase